MARVTSSLSVLFLVTAATSGCGRSELIITEAGDDEIAGESAGDEVDSTGLDESETADSETTESSEEDTTDSSESESTDTESTDTESTGTESTDTESTDTESTESDTDTESESDTGMDPGCSADALAGAFEPTTVDGLEVVPMDILQIQADLEFDVELSLATAEVEMQFRVGEAGGMPLFDLRQTIIDAALDGEPIDPALLARHDFGYGLADGFRVLEQSLEPCSEHWLTASYELEVPDAPEAGGLTWLEDPARLHYDSWSSDLYPGRYLEAWLPANMPFDRQPVILDIGVVGPEVEHTLITNAESESLGDHSWHLEFPDATTAMAPLIIIQASEELEVASGEHLAANGQLIPYAVYKHESEGQSLASLEAETLASLDEFVLSTGEYHHPAMTAYVSPSARSMEYDGALTTKASDLHHEVFHSWWARGIHPATYADGWIDEAWDMYNTQSGWMFTSQAFDFDLEAPVQLYVDDPFFRDTPNLSYWHGRRVFAGLADILGVEELRDAMTELYAQTDALGSLTTAELRWHLYCAADSDETVTFAFWRFVQGNDGPLPGLSPMCR